MKPSKEWLSKMGDLEDQVPSVYVNSVEEYRPTIWERIRWKLFPAKHCFAPEAPADFKDCLTVHTLTKLTFLDRVRVLVTGVIVNTTRTATENEIGRCITASTCHIGTSKDLK